MPPTTVIVYVVTLEAAVTLTVPKADVPANVPMLQSELDKLKKLTLEKRIKPSKAEVNENVRARSAILRVATRI